MTACNRKHAERLKIIIIGGGYAGLTALITLRKQAPDADITLIDPRPYHLIITRLHESVHRPMEKITIAFSQLAKRFDFTHKQQNIVFDEALLKTWDLQKSIELEGEVLPFDYLLMATGALSNLSVNESDIYDLQKISQKGLALHLQNIIATSNADKKAINIIGAGPTGIQFAFELAHVLLNSHVDIQINLIEGCDELLSAFPDAIGLYVNKRLKEKQIALLTSQFFKGKQGSEILLENSHTGEKTTQASALTLLLLGQKPPVVLHANSSGQVVVDQQVLTHIFTAGDCSHYDDMGSNLLTSQSAIRKGKAAANNILREAGMIRFCLPYMHEDIGYLLSLGPGDAVGWVGSKQNIISGLPAYMAKEAIEVQYDLFLSGVDTYVL